MIEGLKVTVNAKELEALCHQRAQYHQDRAAGYRKNLETLESLDVQNKSINPAQEAKEKIKEHDFTAGELLFIAAHLDKNETYLLDRNDLTKLGIGGGSRYY